MPQLTNLYMTVGLLFFDQPVPEIRYTRVANVTAFVTNNLPRVAILHPSDATSYAGIIHINENASDGLRVLSVEVRLNGEP